VKTIPFFLCQQKINQFPGGVVRRRGSDVRERSEGNPSAGAIFILIKMVKNAGLAGL